MASSSIDCINLCDQTDCDWWQEQSVCLIESHGMKKFFLDFRLTSTKENGDSKKKADTTFGERKRSDPLVILIYSSLSEEVLSTAFGIHKTNDVWEKLDAYYKYSTDDRLQALQMQRELQWFKVVEIFEIMVFTKENKGNKDLVFTREHKDLRNKDL